MIEGDAAIYSRIAQSMSEAIPEEWSSAKIEAIFYSDSITFEAEYIRRADGKVRTFATTLDGDRAFRELRKSFKSSGQPVWGSACFELQPDGKFNVKWGYDNCDGNGDTVFDNEQYLRRHEERRKRLTQP